MRTGGFAVHLTIALNLPIALRRAWYQMSSLWSRYETYRQSYSAVCLILSSTN